MLTDKEKDLVTRNFGRNNPRSLASLLDLINSARSEKLTLEKFQELVKDTSENMSDERVDNLFQELNETIDAGNRAEEKAQSAKIMAEAMSSSLAGVNREIIDYALVSGKTTAAVQEEVKKWISWGWQPMGGICAAAFGISPVGGNQYCQALVKYQ